MSKKFILFIVEGYNDQIEINAIMHSPWFDKYRDLYEPYFYVVNGDVLVSPPNKGKQKKKKVSENNIQKVLADIVMDFRRNSGPYGNIPVSDIQEVVQITDTDGVFIPRGSIKRDDDYLNCTYFDDCIKINNVDWIQGRNKKKSAIIKKLLTVKQIGNIPYSLYYASCNMDHVLFDERNANRNIKKDNSRKFALTCKTTPDHLETCFFKSGVMAEGTYDESWEMIQYELNSLKRHTNFNLFFSEKAKNPK